MPWKLAPETRGNAWAYVRAFARTSVSLVPIPFIPMSDLVSFSRTVKLRTIYHDLVRSILFPPPYCTYQALRSHVVHSHRCLIIDAKLLCLRYKWLAMAIYKFPPPALLRLPSSRVRRSPFAVRRSPFAVRRSPFAVITIQTLGHPNFINTVTMLREFGIFLI
jgi:hypothetical protein